MANPNQTKKPQAPLKPLHKPEMISIPSDSAPKKAVAEAVKTTSESAKVQVDVVREMASTGLTEATKLQEFAGDFFKGYTELFSGRSENLGQAFGQFSELLQQQAQAMNEAGRTFQETARQLAEEQVEQFNEETGRMIEVSKQYLSCRTFSELVELNSRVLKETAERSFSRSSDYTDRLFRLTQSLAEPFAAQANEFGEKVGRIFTPKA